MQPGSITGMQSDRRDAEQQQHVKNLELEEDAHLAEGDRGARHDEREGQSDAAGAEHACVEGEGGGGGEGEGEGQSDAARAERSL